jgi:ferritin
MNEKIEKALNEQINYEMYSAYLYLSMAAYCAGKSLPGMASWMRVQFEEETYHALRLFDYITDRGGQVSLGKIDQPPADWDSPLAVFEDVCEHEHKVTVRINNLMDLAISESDHATNAALQWYVSEQVEEEATVGEIRDKLKLIGSEGGGLFMIDKELAGRTFTPPAGE